MANFATAQDNGYEGFNLGLKLGTNYANVYDTQGDDFRADGKFGFAAGAFLAIPLGQFFGVQPEVLFSQKGFKGAGNILGSKYEVTRTTNFIDVPLFLAIKPFEYVTILAGPQFSYLMSQKDEFTNSAITADQIQEFENDDLRNNILSAALGIDINIKQVVVGARAGWDLTNNQKEGASTTPRYRNAWVQATIGYRIL